MASNLPPGVTGSMIEEFFADQLCEICRYFPDACVCPECPVCGEQGNPNCYQDRVAVSQSPEHHDLTITIVQQVGRTKRRITELKEELAEAQMVLIWLESGGESA